MAGHSKWANIKHKKAAVDKKRGKIFTKLIREITVAARLGGGDVGSNPRLRTAIDKALSANMTRDTIDRAVKKGAGDDEGTNLEEIRYEGYGIAGVAVMVDCMTDNRNRTVAEVRHAFSKHGGNLGTDGSVAYLFTQQGMLYFDSSCDEDKLIEVALEAGAEDVVQHEDDVTVVTSPDHLVDVKESIVHAGFEPLSAEIEQVASTQITLSDAEQAEKFVRFIDRLEYLDDVQEVHSNVNIPNTVLAQLSGE